MRGVAKAQSTGDGGHGHVQLIQYLHFRRLLTRIASFESCATLARRHELEHGAQREYD
jgi:hypothetical protein